MCGLVFLRFSGSVVILLCIWYSCKYVNMFMFQFFGRVLFLFGRFSAPRAPPHLTLPFFLLCSVFRFLLFGQCLLFCFQLMSKNTVLLTIL